MRQLILLSSMLFLTACVSKETTTATVEALREAGKDLAAEVRTQAGQLASDLVATARIEFDRSKGDILAAAKGALSEIPSLATEAGKKAAAEALAKRIEEMEGSEKAAEFRKRAESEGLWEALNWSAGGGGLALALYLFRLLKRKGQALSTITRGVEDLPEDLAAQVKEAIGHAGGMVPAIRDEIRKAKA